MWINIHPNRPENHTSLTPRTRYSKYPIGRTKAWGQVFRNNFQFLEKELSPQESLLVFSTRNKQADNHWNEVNKESLLQSGKHKVMPNWKFSSHFLKAKWNENNQNSINVQRSEFIIEERLFTTLSLSFEVIFLLSTYHESKDTCFNNNLQAPSILIPKSLP